MTEQQASDILLCLRILVWGAGAIWATLVIGMFPKDK